MSEPWQERDAPRQDGRVFVVTGANSGIGLEVSCMLARAGAHVVMACRNPEKAVRALEHLRGRVPDGSAQILSLDLADTDRIRRFATVLFEEHPRIHALVNNAGVMAISRATTAQGFEMQLGVNHLGHFALTCLVLPRLAEDGRVVNVSSEAHRAGKMHFDDLMLEKSYGRWKAYLQSKLANILFTRELQRRLTDGQQKPGVRAVCCHPGYSATNLQARTANALESWFLHAVSNRLLAQSARMGALPTLRAACDPDLPKNAYVGPTEFFRVRGYPRLDTPSRAGQDDADAQRLWQASAELTGFDIARDANASTNTVPASPPHAPHSDI